MRQNQDEDATRDCTGRKGPDRGTEKGPAEGHEQGRQLAKKLNARDSPQSHVSIAPMDGNRIEAVQKNGDSDDGNQNPENRLVIKPRVGNSECTGRDPESNSACGLQRPGRIQEGRIVPPFVTDYGWSGTDGGKIGKPFEEDICQTIKTVVSSA